MQISVSQIKQNELTLFVQQASSGSTFSGNFVNYVANSGWVGPNVLSTTGGLQFTTGVKVFLDSPIVPSGGGTSTAANKDYVTNLVNSGVEYTRNYISLGFVSTTGNDVILGVKRFTGALGVGTPTKATDATTISYVSGASGYLQYQISNITVSDVVYTSGNQIISGTKIFVGYPLVPTPINDSGAVPKSYVDSIKLTGIVYETGNQTISGVKTFLNSPLIPVAVSTNQPVTLAQLQATAFNYAPTSGYSVTSINGITGGILTQGANGITTYMCDNILYISGNIATTSLLYTAQIPLTIGATGVSFVWGTGFASKPTVTSSLEVTGNSAISFISTNLYNVTTGGFNVAFQSGIPHSNYILNFTAIPTTSGSGFFGIRGEQGQAQPTWNSRGAWQAGLAYNKYDFVFLSENSNSYVALTGNNSDNFNKPAGTGFGPWAIVASGRQGDIGPTGAIGNLIIASGGYITGSFTNISYYLSPVGSGLNLAESFIGYRFNITGYKLGCITSGSYPLFGGVLSGKLYVRDDNNIKTTLQNFTFNTGIFTYFSGGLGIPFTGGYRLGLDITNTMSGIEGFSVGVFGF